MNLNQYQSMNPIMLMSILNLKLRDEFSSLDDLTKFYEIDQAQLLAHMKSADFDYLPEVNQFR